MPRREIPAHKLSYLRLLAAINHPAIDVTEIDQVIKREPDFSHKLLRYLNSFAFGFPSNIKSIRHGISLLGQRQMKVWASMVAMTSLVENKIEEVVVTSFIRANMCEWLATQTGMQSRKEGYFLLGLFSVLDTILGLPMPEVLAQLPLPEDINDALLLRNNRLADMLSMVQAYERGKWKTVTGLATTLKVNAARLTEIYLSAAEQAQQVFQLS